MNCFAKILEVNPKQQGWCSPEKAITLASLVIALRPKLSLEIGVFGGRSLIPLALAHKEVGGKVIGIDPWTAQAATEGYDSENVNWWNNQEMLDGVKKQTFQWIETLHLGNHCEIIQKKSKEVTPPDGLELCHVDGQHTEASMWDVSRFVLPMKPGSICVMDDIDWKNQGVSHVSMACDLLLQNGWKKLYKLETGGVFVRL